MSYRGGHGYQASGRGGERHGHSGNEREEGVGSTCQCTVGKCQGHGYIARQSLGQQGGNAAGRRQSGSGLDAVAGGHGGDGSGQQMRYGGGLLGRWRST